MGRKRKAAKQFADLAESDPDLAQGREIMESFLANDAPPQKKEDLPSKHSKNQQKAIKKNIKCDLHGLTVAEAKSQVEQLVSSLEQTTQLQIITGKGRHSGPEGGILIKEIYHFVKTKYQHRTEKIDHDPSQDLLNGLPIKGYFHVTLKR